MKHSFGSDNHSGVNPIIMNAIIAANSEFALAYGEDELTKEVLTNIENLFGGNCKALFVMNGTGANILALSVLANSYESIICPNTAHINVDECGAPEKFIGAKLVSICNSDGKVDIEDVRKQLINFGEQHHSQPKVLSISQPTELGTVYTPTEIKELADLMHSHGCYLYMDGSRLSNAAASLKLNFKEFTQDVGVDVVSFGGTKNGMLMGEAVIFFNQVNHKPAVFLRKQLTQLYSKGRFIAAQFKAYTEENLYLKMAEHSNSMAKYFEASLKIEVPNIKITRPVQTNAIFARMSKESYNEIRKKHYFYIWDEDTMEVRWMCSFNTTKEDIDNFISDLKEIETN